MKAEIGKAIGGEAGKIKAQTGIDVSALIDDALKDDDGEKPQAGNTQPRAAMEKPKAAEEKGEAPRASAPPFIAAETMPLPKGARKISRDPSKQSITFETDETPETQEEFFNSKLKPLGWDTVLVSRGTVNNDIQWTLGYNNESVDLEISLRYQGASRTGTTVISGKGLRFDPALGGAAAPKPVQDGAMIAEDVQGLPIPKEHNGHSAESTPFRKSVETRAKTPLDALAAFYRKELADRGWKEKDLSPPARTPAEKDKLAMAFTSEQGALDVTLTRGTDETTVSMIERKTEAARKAGILPNEGRARLVIGNGFKADAVIEINGKPFTVMKETGTKNPESAYKLDLFPGKNQVVIKLPGEDDQSEVVDAAAGDSWGLMIVETGGALVVRLY